VFAFWAKAFLFDFLAFILEMSIKFTSNFTDCFCLNYLGNGARRAFTSPDGKATIKLTAFSPPSSIDVKETYIGKSTFYCCACVFFVCVLDLRWL